MITQLASNEEILTDSRAGLPNSEPIEFTNVINFFEEVEKKRSELVMNKLKELVNTIDLY